MTRLMIDDDFDPDCRHTGHVVTKFNGGNRWTLCGQCRVRICGKRTRANERCVLPADHRGDCVRRMK